MKKSMLIVSILALFTAACSSSNDSKKSCEGKHNWGNLTEKQKECVKKHMKANDCKENEDRAAKKECKKDAFKSCKVEMPEKSGKPAKK